MVGKLYIFDISLARQAVRVRATLYATTSHLPQQRPNMGCQPIRRHAEPFPRPGEKGYFGIFLAGFMVDFSTPRLISPMWLPSCCPAPPAILHSFANRRVCLDSTYFCWRDVACQGVTVRRFGQDVRHKNGRESMAII